jgi:DNA polymerase III subunit epsilon
MKLERALVVFDVETTGVDVCKDRIIELGVVTLRPDGTRSPRWNQRFNPGIPIPPEATEVHHITDADVASCPPFSDFAQRIFAGLSGKDLGVYNGWRLDLPILDEELRRCGLKLDLTGVRVIDCFGIFSKKDPRKLEDAVRKYCGREHEGAHGAGADAEATLDVLVGQMEAHEDLSGMSIDQVAEYSFNRDVRPADVGGKLYRDKEGKLRFGFGKNKDLLVNDCLDYVDWMLRKGQFPGSTIEVLRQETGL